ncbi:MAG TPA: phosphoribosylanthranilate isomerase [Gaiellales bacterium]
MTLVKICGLTREEDVDAAVAAGADMVGFVLVPDTPRYVQLDRARALAARAPAGVRTVAVVGGGPMGSDPSDAGVRPRSVEGFDLVQTYDTPADFRDTIVAARGEPPAGVPDDVPVLLDLPYGSRPDAEELHKHWERAARVRGRVLLAGSLHPGNVAEAIAVARPWAVDTSRGVEAAPGVKDHDLVRAFVRAAKEAM